MATTTSAAIKAFIEQLGLNISVYRDEAPSTVDPTKTAYIEVTEAVALVPDPSEDGEATTLREHCTVNLWQPFKSVTSPTGGGSGRTVEDPTLAEKLVKALHMSTLMQGVPNANPQSLPPAQVYGVVVHSAGPRLVDVEENVVHYPIWIEIARKVLGDAE